jgi:hypothetical protein
MTANIETLTASGLKDLANTSAYTITGAGGNLTEWTEGYTKMLAEQGIGTPSKWFTFSGKDMNEAFELTESKRYKKSVTFLAFLLEGLDIGKLAMFKLRMNDRWFDDIVANNKS